MLRMPLHPSRLRCLVTAAAVLFATVAPSARAATSVSAWDASNFRMWGYIPYWATNTQINNFATNGLYTHVSDVLYFGGLRPDTSGNLTWASSNYQTQFNTIRSQSQAIGFDFHLSMFEVIGGQTDTTWQSIINSPANRANFVNQLKTIMQGGAGTADDLKGFNFDWERPDTGSDWGNYTQLARELRTAINPLGMEVSVCDYGSTDANWDDTALFDAKVYDQLFMMIYHLSAADTITWANTKKTLTQQGAAKAFSDNQIGVGVGTWGDGVGSAPTVSLQSIVNVNPNLAYDALTFTGTIGSTTNGTWNIVSRKEAREKTQVAFDRGMPGMFTWTLHYDATGNLGLHRVMHHYTVVQKQVPDLNLDGKVDTTDATTLANNMGMSLTATGVGAGNSAQFDAFYLNGNWEKGDRDGNGFVNQADADWLASRYNTLGVTLPDRLPFTGTFESHSNSKGLTGRWRGGRDGSNNLRETSNFKQEAPNFLVFSASGAGANLRSNNFVTIRNQNTAEVAAATNIQSRVMQADLATPMDLSQNKSFYFTFLAKENTGALSASQLGSANRTLALEFLDASGVDQFDFILRGFQADMQILHEADTGGQDVTQGGGSAGATYFIVGKIDGNGTGANTLQASVFTSGQTITDFTQPGFAWMLSATSSAGYNPIITDVQFTTLAEGNFTVSNLWLGEAATFIPEPGSASLLLIGLATLMSRRSRLRDS